MKARLLIDMLGFDGYEQTPQGRRHKVSSRPAGTVIDHPEAYLLVRQGCAEAADDECTAAVQMTAEQLANAQVHYEMVSKGIAPEDYDAYLAGAMTGYDDQGNFIPGPNFAAWAEAHGVFDDEQPEEATEPGQ